MFMFTSAQMFTTTLSVYKALLQLAFIEIWILLIHFKYFQREKQKLHNTELKLFPKRCAMLVLL